MNKLIEFKNICFSKREKKIIDNINLVINENEKISIIGCNGSGKTTLAKIMSLLIYPSDGEFFFNNKKVNFDDNSMFEIRKNIGIVFQNPENQFFCSTVKDDIAFGLENNCVPQNEMEEKIQEIAKEIGIVDLLNKNPQQLSGGQKQKVAIADILVLLPKIIIFDESFSMLDDVDKKNIFEIINKVRKKYNISIINITHDLNSTLDSDRIIVMEKGKIVLNDTPEKVFLQDEYLKSLKIDIPFIFKINLALEKAGIIKEKNFSLEELAKKICK